VDSVLATRHEYKKINIKDYKAMDVFWRAWDIGGF